MGSDLLPVHVEWDSALASYEKHGDVVFDRDGGTFCEDIKMHEPKCWRLADSIRGRFFNILTRLSDFILSQPSVCAETKAFAEFIVTVDLFGEIHHPRIVRNEVTGSNDSPAWLSPKTCTHHLAHLEAISMEDLERWFIEFAEREFDDQSDNAETFEGIVRVIDKFVTLLREARDRSCGVYFHWWF